MECLQLLKKEKYDRMCSEESSEESEESSEERRQHHWKLPAEIKEKCCLTEGPYYHANTTNWCWFGVGPAS